MNLGFREPPARLTPFVRRFVTSDYALGGELVFHPWPTGNIYLTWFFGPPRNYSVAIDGQIQRLVEPLWLAGQIEYHQVRIAIAQRTSAVVAELMPQSFWRLFGRPGRLLTGKTCLASDVAPVHAKRTLCARSLTADDCLERMTAFLTAAAETAGPSDPMLERALSAIERHHGRIGVNEVAALAGVSPRHLTRRFTEIVGLSPKFYARVLQINQVVEALFLPGCDTIAAAAQEGGFYDQAHLNRAMKLFFSEGPTAFLKSDHLLFRTFLEQRDTAVP